MISETIEKKKVTANEAIIRMLRTLNEGKGEAIYAIAEEYLRGIAQKGGTAWSIKSLLRDKPKMMHQLRELPHDLRSILSPEPTQDTLLFLTAALQEQLDTLLLEWDNVNAFAAYNIPVRNKILLYGKSGNGKTTFAKKIANSSNRPYYEVKSASMIASHLGDTGRNLEKLFGSISGNAMIFYDEVDSVGLKRRSSAKDHEEMARAQNVLLIHLEKLQPEVVFIGATNRFEELDSAFVRRFDVLIEMPEPGSAEKLTYLSFLADHHNLSTDERNFFHPIYENNNSYSDIKRAFIDVLRQRVIASLK